MLAAVAQGADHNRGQGVRALQPHEMPGEEFDTEDVGTRPVWHQFTPVRTRRCRERRRDDAKIDRAA